MISAWQNRTNRVQTEEHASQMVSAAAVTLISDPSVVLVLTAEATHTNQADPQCNTALLWSMPRCPNGLPRTTFVKVSSDNLKSLHSTRFQAVLSRAKLKVCKVL